MMTRDHLLSLVSAYAAYVGRSEATISNTIIGSARLFSRLRAGLGCNIGTAERAMAWFDANWPADLPWPADVPRTAFSQLNEERRS